MNSAIRNQLLQHFSKFDTMPHLIIYAEFLDGPTYVGDLHSDANLMMRLGATFEDDHTWVSPNPARVVLDQLELEGYQIVSTTGFANNVVPEINQRAIVWTLHRPSDC